jgi:hypothetical protein
VIAVLAGALLVAGLFVDGWHHVALPNGHDASFFTPWHIPLYAGFNACAIWTITRNARLREMLAPQRGSSRAAAMGPAGLGWVVVGLAIAAIGIVGDAIARSTGGRADGEAIGPPFNLLLFAGAAVVFVVAIRTVAGRTRALRGHPGRGRVDRRVAIPALAALGAAAIAFVALGGTSPRERDDRVGSAIAARPGATTHPRAQADATSADARPTASTSSRAHRTTARRAAPGRHRTARRAATAAHARRLTAAHHARRHHARRHHARRAHRIVPTHRVAVHRRHRAAARPAPRAPARRHRRRPAWRPEVVAAAPSAAPTVVTTTTTTTVADSPSAAPTPATKPSDPVTTPTGGPTPVTTPTPTPAPAPAAGGPGPGRPGPG